MLLAMTCMSCAAGRHLNVPVPRAGGPDLRWPPVPVDGYVTADGLRHELPGGYMIETGDSLVFVQRTTPGRPALLTPRRPVRPTIVHRDSVSSVAARIEEPATSPAAAVLGGAVLMSLLYSLLLFGGYPWLVWGS